MKGCVVCVAPLGKVSGWMCDPCARSYERQRDKDSTTMGLVVWAAQRARTVITARKMVIGMMRKPGVRRGTPGAGTP